MSILVTTNGCFDLLHVGHVRGLREAKALGTLLLVGLNNDKSVAAYKPGRPIVVEAERKELLENLSCVDGVELMEETYLWLESVAKRRPPGWKHIHVKGSEWQNSLPPVEMEVIERYGIELAFLARPEHGPSTSALVRRIRDLS